MYTGNCNTESLNQGRGFLIGTTIYLVGNQNLGSAQKPASDSGNGEIRALATVLQRKPNQMRVFAFLEKKAAGGSGICAPAQTKGCNLMSTQYSTSAGSTTIDPSKVNLTEADIEEYLWQNPEAVRFIRYDVLSRNVKRWLKRQYQVPSGIIDLLGVSNEGEIVIVEIKNVEIDANAIAQVCRYAFDIEYILCNIINDNFPKHRLFKVLVGPPISTKALRECEACEVSFCQFDVSLSLATNGIGWTSEFKHDRREVIERLSQDETLIDAVSELIHHQPSDIFIDDGESWMTDAVKNLFEQTADEDGNEAAK